MEAKDLTIGMLTLNIRNSPRHAAHGTPLCMAERGHAACWVGVSQKDATFYKGIF